MDLGEGGGGERKRLEYYFPAGPKIRGKPGVEFPESWPSILHVSEHRVHVRKTDNVARLLSFGLRSTCS